MSTPDPVRVAAGRYAYTCRRDVSPEARADALRDLTAAQLERAIREARESAPALTDEQTSHLVGLLQGR